ncbi:MAG TPA: hypothetical protein VGX03_10890 [Candidatus Binatia bacterium]|jgi:hypothetical protein|nr:hypothetical protein [Candidatus Binatia bacterium]
MNMSYVIPVVLFALGIGLLLLMVGTSPSEEVALLGLTFSPRIAKGLGIVVMIFSAVSLLVAYGSSLLPN